MDELLRRFRAADACLRQLSRDHDPSGIVLEIKKGATPRTLQDLLPEVEAHVRNHHGKLERWLRHKIYSMKQHGETLNRGSKSACSPGPWIARTRPPAFPANSPHDSSPRTR